MSKSSDNREYNRKETIKVLIDDVSLGEDRHTLHIDEVTDAHSIRLHPHKCQMATAARRKFDCDDAIFDNKGLTIILDLPSHRVYTRFMPDPFNKAKEKAKSFDDGNVFPHGDIVIIPVDQRSVAKRRALTPEETEMRRRVKTQRVRMAELNGNGKNGEDDKKTTVTKIKASKVTEPEPTAPESRSRGLVKSVGKSVSAKPDVKTRKPGRFDNWAKRMGLI